MNKLKKCQKCGKYTLKQEHCKLKTQDAGYKFIKIKKIREFNTKTLKSAETLN